MKCRETITTDVLVVGAGLAGLRAAERAKRYGLDVVIADKGTGRTNASSMSGGGIGIDARAWQISNPNSLDSLFRNKVLGGAWEIRYGKDQRMEEITAWESVPMQDELGEFGCLNPRDVKSYAWYSRNGWALTGPLYHHVQKIGCKLMKFFTVTDLLTLDGRVVGAVGFDASREDFIVVNAKAVVLATGGAGHCWARTSEPSRMTGDGHAIAYHNGVEMHMMEYQCFDAWIIAEKGLPQYWILPSYGRTMATVLNASGEDFLEKYVEVGPNATLKRGDPFHKKYGAPVIDSVTAIGRGMAMEIYEGRGENGAVLADFTRIPEEVFMSEGYGIAFLHLMRDFDWKKKPVHVAPATEGSYGGINITTEGDTSLPGLFAGGEVSYGEDLQYTNVFGNRAGRAAAEYAMNIAITRPDPIQIKEKKDYLEQILSRTENPDGNPKAVKQAIRDISMKNFWILKTEAGLKEGLAKVRELQKITAEHLYARDGRELRLACEVNNMLTCQEMHARASILRTETRGPHNRLDYPYMDNDLWIKDIRIKKNNGNMDLYTRPLRLGYVKIPAGRIPIKGMPQPD